MTANVVLATGFEMGSVGEAFANGAGVSVQSTTKRTGTYAARFNPSAAASNLNYQIRDNAGALSAVFHSIAGYIRYVSGNTSEVISFYDSTLTTTNHGLSLDGSGNIYIYASAVSSNSAVIPNDGLFHSFWADFGDHSGAGATLYIDGFNVASCASGAISAQPILVLGGAPSANRTTDFYLDDIVVFDASTTGILWPGGFKVLSLLPISDNAVGSGWVNGALGSTNLWDAVNNVPPVGVALANETATSQIKNSASVNSYDVNLQTYTTVGVLATEIIRAVQPVCNHSQTGVTVKTGTVFCQSNPAPGIGKAFNWADSVGVAGVFPSNWRTIFGRVEQAPSVTLGNSPVLRLTKVTSSSQNAFADYMALNVVVSPAPTFSLPIFQRPWRFLRKVRYS